MKFCIECQKIIENTEATDSCEDCRFSRRVPSMVEELYEWRKSTPNASSPIKPGSHWIHPWGKGV